MKKILFTSIRLTAICVFFILGAFRSYGTHIYGADLYYTWVSGNQYTINMVVYGDCSASPVIFNSLYTATPEIQIYNGALLTQTINLLPGTPQGVEVTPVCASQINNTACNGGTIPGVRKFVYAQTITLSTASANWKFHFDGNMGPSSSAGRSNTITNVLNAGSTIIALDATLNNLSASNSSPIYTTIPTPFFCINQPANYNPGAVDADNDSLSFALVAGQDANTGLPVIYISPYTATQPLAVAPGTFSFNSNTGQLSFTPNAAQTSLVVYTVSEYRGGQLVGTSQREMSYVILSTCNNSPPTGSITNASGSGVSIVDSTDFNACSSTGSFSFQINPTDPNANNITVSYAGLPTGSTFTITNNSTSNPLCTFSWNTTGITPGAYTFYVTYQDDGCPLSSKQTQAYTVNVLPLPTNIYTLISPATCAKKAVFQLTPGGTGSPWSINVINGGNTIQTFTGLTGPQTDSLAPGTYTFRVSNVNGCYKDTTITITAPPPLTVSVSLTTPACIGSSNGSITVTGGGGTSPYTYAINTNPYASSNTFSNLSVGVYALHVQDANACIKDTSVVLQNPLAILANISTVKPWCNQYQNGSITVNAYNSISPYQYALDAGVYNTINTFGNLGAGTYTVHIKNANGCTKDTIITLADSLTVQATVPVTNIFCHGDSSGVIIINATGGYGSPYTYAINSGSFTTGNTFNHLPSGTYTVHVHDANLCYFDTTINISQPTALAIAPAITNVSCNGGNNGQLTATASGGVSPYSYSINGGTYGSANTFGNLTAGTYYINVKDANNCIKYDTLVIQQPSPLSITSIAIQNVHCNGSTDGSFTVSASGGTPSYTYAVNTSAYSTSNVIGSLSAGTYTIHVKDTHGCTHDTTLSIQQPAAIVPGALVVQSVCHTLSNGSVTLSATGGTPSYTYSMGSSAYGSPAIFSPLAAGTYAFHIKDNNGCIKDTTITLHDSLTVVSSIATTPAICYGQSNGTIAATGIGGASPYTYAMGSGAYSPTNTFGNLAAGTYTIHTKDANGCIQDTSIAVTQPTIVVPHVTVTAPSCYEYNDASLSVSASGGTPSYTFALNSTSFTATPSYNNLFAGTDTVYVKDANGCTRDTVFTIMQPATLTIDSFHVTNVKCFGDSSGTITIYVSGGTSPFTYASYGAFQASNVLTGIPDGTQAVHIKDNNGCIRDSLVTLTQPEPLLINIDSMVNPTCAGFKDGLVNISGTGGTMPYAYAVNTSAFGTSGSFTGLAEGSYIFHITDSNSCVHDTDVTLIGYPHIIINNVTVDNISCYNNNDGKIIVDASGGMPPLTYLLSTADSAVYTNTFTNLDAQQYTITISDSVNCKVDTTVAITRPDSLTLNTTIAANNCLGVSDDGAISVAVNGGTPPYTYLWSTNPPQTTPALSGLPNGNYMVWVRDSSNCVDSALVTIQYDDCCKPFIPSAFTPNGDGRNDLFRIRYKGDMKLEEFSIYNRYGQRVYYSLYIDQGWDGTFHGVPQDLGVYFYYVKATCGNGGTHEVVFQGDVTLVR